MIGKDLEEHNKRPQRILEKLSESKITLNYDKCEFAKSEIKFLGEAIDQNGVCCDPLKVKAITEIPQPNSRTGFLVWQTSLVSFDPSYPSKSNQQEICCAQRMTGYGIKNPLNSSKKNLSANPILALFDPEKETIVSSDASSYWLGAVLKQKQPGGEIRPIAYILHSLTDTEQRYTQLEKEALVLTWASEILSNYLIGHQTPR